MTRTQSFVTVDVHVLVLCIRAFLSGSMVFATGAEATFAEVTDATPQRSVEVEARAGQAAAIAAITKLGGRISFDKQNNLTKLDLDGTKVVDADLMQLKRLAQLESLSLNRTNVTDAGLEHLKAMTQLSNLELYETTVSDAGLEHLNGLAQLKFLMLKRTNVTATGVNQLQQSLPNCLISHSPRDPRIAEIIPLVGRWSVEFANGVKQTCEIQGDGAASVVEAARTSGGKAGVQNEKIVIAYDDERIERWTIVGKRFVVEHWAPVPGSQQWNGHPPLRPLPTSAPVLGIAKRAR